MKHLAPVIARIGPVISATASFPMMPWFPAAFLSSTRGWSLTARGIYRELLDCQWEIGALPANQSELQKLIGATAVEWKAWPIVASKFPLNGDGTRGNPTLEKHRSKSVELSERHRRGAEKTNAKRWGPRIERFPDQGDRHDR